MMMLDNQKEGELGRGRELKIVCLSNNWRKTSHQTSELPLPPFGNVKELN